MGEPAYRARQVWQAVYRNMIADPIEIPNIPKALRSRLGEYFDYNHLIPESTLQSSDGETVKTLFRLPDNQALETVLMRYEERRRYVFRPSPAVRWVYLLRDGSDGISKEPE